MMTAIDQILDNLQNVMLKDLGNPCFTSKDYRSIPFDNSYFTNFDLIECKKKIAFIDGGSQKILEIPTLSIQFNRAYFNIYDGFTKSFIRQKSRYFEFISITKATLKDDYPHYQTIICNSLGDLDSYYPKETDLEFDPRKETTMDNQLFDIGRVSPIARRFAEWAIAKYVMEDILHEGDIIVMDGTLKASFPNETKFAKECYELASSKNITFTGLSKSSRLFTTTGISLTGAVLEMSKRRDFSKIWFYNPIAQSLSPTHAAELYITKLHPLSNRVFRFDIQSDHVKSLEHTDLIKIFSLLSLNSSDPCFLGYPYGLIDADFNARVRSDEVAIYKNLILSKACETDSWNRFKIEMNSLDAHDILNLL